MSQESATTPESAAAPDDAQRGKSTIEFPYLDLDNAIEIAKAVRDVAGDRCEWNQLATKLAVAPEGGGFRMRMLAAKVFGVLYYERGQVSLTELGIRAADPAHEKRARTDAFLTVPLFKLLFERLNGQPLPPLAAIERMAQSAGVAPKQKDKARQVFLRSAKQAGFFELSSDRLSMPPGGGATPRMGENSGSNQHEKEHKPRGGSGGGGHSDLNPFIQGLLAKLPPTDDEWPLEARAKWLTTAANIFDLMYTNPTAGDTRTILVTVN